MKISGAAVADCYIVVTAYKASPALLLEAVAGCESLSFGSQWEDAMRKTKMLQYVFAAATGLAVCGSAYAEDWKAIGKLRLVRGR